MRSISADFARFQSEYPLQRLTLPRTDLEWSFYKAGPDRDRDPIVFLHGATGTAASFFYQVDCLASKGYRVVSAQYPAHGTIEEWCKSFDLFLDGVRCRNVHIFGAGLGGYLAQHFCASHPQRVRSLMLCNSFLSTHFMADQVGTLANWVHFTPTPLLRKVMLDSFPTGGMELAAKQAIDWVAAQVHELSGQDIASRLSLNCIACTVDEISLDQRMITLLESNGGTTVPDVLRREVRNRYPEARSAMLKAGGDFPYLSRHDEATMFVEVHMRGAGVFAGGIPPALRTSARPNGSQAGSGVDSSSAAAAASAAGDSEEAGEEEVPAPPVRRPVWRNPFEDDPLL